MSRKVLKTLILILFFIQFCFAARTVYEIKDILFHKQWGMKNTGQIVIRRKGALARDEIKGIPGKDINWVSMKEILPKNTRDAVVAVIDTGLDINHPDLKDRIWINKQDCVAEEEHLCHGWDFLENNPEVSEDPATTGILALMASSRADFIDLPWIKSGQPILKLITSALCMTALFMALATTTVNIVFLLLYFLV